jgi:hypothetical protein
MSYGSFDYLRINADIQALAAQLQPDQPRSFTHTAIGQIVIGVVIAVVGGLLLFYLFHIK